MPVQPVLANFRAAAVAALLVISFAAFARLADRDVVIYGANRAKEIELVGREKALVADTVRLYNKILSDFYASGGLYSMLDRFPATRPVKHGIFRDLGYIRSAGKVLVYDHAESRPLSVTFTAPGKAELQMYEEWNYLYQKSDDRTPVTRPKGMGQGFRYGLVRQGGEWLVESWDPETVDEPRKKKEFYY